MDIIKKTRNSLKLSLGASPRATLMMIQSSRAYAFLKGRNYVIPDDLITLFPYVLPHRFVLSTEGRIGNVNVENIVAEIVEKTHVPVLPN